MWQLFRPLGTLPSLQPDNTESSELVLLEIAIAITLTFSAFMNSDSLLYADY